MAQQTINNGDSGLDAREKINDNFTELYNGSDTIVSGTLSSAQILGSGSAGVDVVPAPGAGLVNIPYAFYLKLNYNSAPYATNTICRMEMGNTIVMSNNSVLLPATATQWAHQHMAENTGLNTSIANQAVKFRTVGGNPTGGDSTISYTILYRIVPES